MSIGLTVQLVPYTKINSTLVTLASNPPINGFVYYDDPTDEVFLNYYYKITAVNVDSYEGSLFCIHFN